MWIARLQTMSSYWVNFARKGDPNGAGLPNWPSYREPSDTLMVFGDAIQERPVPRKSALDFLEAQFKQVRSSSRD